MDILAVLNAFINGAGPWAGLAIWVLIMWERGREKDEKSVRESVNALTAAVETLSDTFARHDARLERCAEVLMRLDAHRKEG